jgi:hypothetical protein
VCFRLAIQRAEHVVQQDELRTSIHSARDRLSRMSMIKRPQQRQPTSLCRCPPERVAPRALSATALPSHQSARICTCLYARVSPDPAEEAPRYPDEVRTRESPGCRTSRRTDCRGGCLATRVIVRTCCVANENEKLNWPGRFQGR